MCSWVRERERGDGRRGKRVIEKEKRKRGGREKRLYHLAIK